jgi:hypothetical protein
VSARITRVFLSTPFENINKFREEPFKIDLMKMSEAASPELKQEGTIQDYFDEDIRSCELVRK